MYILTNFQLGKKKLRQKYFLNISEDEKDPLQVRDRRMNKESFRF